MAEFRSISRLIDEALAARVETSLESVDEALVALERAAERATSTAEKAVAAGIASDWVGFAVLGGYAAALEKLLGGAGVSRPVRRASFCVTEEPGGGHPSAMKTRLDERGGAWFVTGVKSFATLASHAEMFVVIGATGPDDATARREGDGRARKPLRAAIVERGATGLVLVPRPPLPFVPEVPHCAIELTDVPVAELLPGDGYERYVKPFRTVEDAHVTLAILGHALREARAFGWEGAALRRSVEALAEVADLLDSTLPETHLALDAAMGAAERALDGLPWVDAPGEVGARWERDRPILTVAARARAKRTERAKEKLSAR